MLQLTKVEEATIAAAATSKQSALNLQDAQLYRCPRRTESSHVVRPEVRRYLQALERQAVVLIPFLVSLLQFHPLMLSLLRRTVLQDLGRVIQGKGR